MNFNKLINSILKEDESPSRVDRIQALDNLEKLNNLEDRTEGWFAFYFNYEDTENVDAVREYVKANYSSKDYNVVAEYGEPRMTYLGIKMLVEDPELLDLIHKCDGQGDFEEPEVVASPGGFNDFPMDYD
jgi:hypothetical protein